MEALAAEYGVRYFTRKGRPAWNSPVRRSRPRPRRKRQRLARPRRHAATSTTTSSSSSTSTIIRPRNTSTARSATSTIPRWRGCRRRAWAATSSWTARGLAEQDLVLQGPLQMGFYGHSRTPFIIGSHTVPDRGGAGHRRLPADPRRGPPGRSCSPPPGTPACTCPRSSPPARSRRLRDLSRPAVRVGVLDGADLPAAHAAPGAPVHARAGVPVPHGPGLVHAGRCRSPCCGCCRSWRC